MEEEIIINREIAKKLMEIEGEARGVHLKNDGEYVLAKAGKEGLRKVEEELKDLGRPIEYGKVKNLGFYPVGLRAVSLLAIKKALNWDDEEIRNLGGFAVTTSSIIRLYARFFYSVEKILGHAAKIWDEYFTKGKVNVKEYNEKEKYVILVIEQFSLHPLFCRCLEGYLKKIAEIVLNSGTVTCRETNCFLRPAKTMNF